MDTLGAVLLAVATLLASVTAAWLTSRGTRRVERDKNETSQIGLLIAAYQKDRADDAAEISTLKADVIKQGKEIEELKAKFPRFRAYIRKLRHLVEALGGDPGDWPEGLE